MSPRFEILSLADNRLLALEIEMGPSTNAKRTIYDSVPHAMEPRVRLMASTRISAREADVSWRSDLHGDAAR